MDDNEYSIARKHEKTRLNCNSTAYRAFVSKAQTLIHIGKLVINITQRGVGYQARVVQPMSSEREGHEGRIRGLMKVTSDV